MGFTANSGKDFVKVPTGVHLARCYEVIDLGTQEYEYLGKLKSSHKILIKWEIHSEDDEGNKTFTADGAPLSQSEEFNLSIGEKSNLGRMLVSWRGKEFTAEERTAFDVSKLLGVWCMLSIIAKVNQQGSEFRNVNGATPVPAIIKRQGLPEGHNPLKLFDLDKPDLEFHKTFSDKLKDKISKSPEWKAINKSLPAATTASSLEDMFDDIPF